jgi:hypothetical protein
LLLLVEELPALDAKGLGQGPHGAGLSAVFSAL